MIAYSACNEPKFVTTNHLSTKNSHQKWRLLMRRTICYSILVVRALNDSICFAAIVIAYLGRKWSRTGLQE